MVKLVTLSPTNIEFIMFLAHDNSDKFVINNSYKIPNMKK
jgi:hypothetical protein